MVLDVAALADAHDADEIDTVIVACCDLYGRLVGKRFDAGFFLESIDDGTHACDYLFTVDVEMEPIPGYSFASWEQGYGDVHLVPDLATMRRAAWTEATAIVLCDVVDHDGVPVSVAPRSVLRRQVERLAHHGYRAEVASELEFFLFDDTYREAAAAGYVGLTPSGHYIEDYHLLSTARIEPFMRAARRALNGAGVPVENSKGEWAAGQHELNVRHGDVLEMADRHVLLKHVLKDIADSMGLSVTFMAKPLTDAAGSSSHLHLSLRYLSDDSPVFADDAGQSAFDAFLAGWMRHVDDVMVCYAPTVNSYKRYVDGSWAPTRIAWSEDNRTAGFRAVGHGNSRRIENRIPGADCNPYLAYAASIASGLAGIENALQPEPAFVGDVYAAADLPRVPRTLEHATEQFAASDFARSVFGDDVVDHYAHFHRTEVASHHAAVSDWERARYFERG